MKSEYCYEGGRAYILLTVLLMEKISQSPLKTEQLNNYIPSDQYYRYMSDSELVNNLVQANKLSYSPFRTESKGLLYQK